MAALQPMGVQAVAKGVGNFNRQIDSMNKSVDKGNKALADTEKTSLSLDKTMVGLGAAIGVAGAAMLAVKKAFDIGREGALISQTGESFEFLLEKVGAAPDLLNQLTVASKGTISELDLMSSTATLLAGAGDDLAVKMAEATPRLLEIAKAANKLNPALGDTTFLYQSIATGVKRAQPLILDNLGITIKVGEANEAFAQSIGKAVDELTAEEKAMAILQGTLEAGDNLIEQVGGNTDSATDSFDRLTVALGVTTDAAKVALFEGLQPIVDSMADAVIQGNLFVESTKELGFSVGKFGIVTDMAGNVVAMTTDEIIAAAAANRELADVTDETAGAIVVSNQVTQASTSSMKIHGDAVADAAAGYSRLDTNILGAVDQAKNQIAFIAAGGLELVGLAEKVQGAFQEGLIPEDKAQELLNQIGLAGIAIEEEIGNITPWQAQQRAVEDYDFTWENARGEIDAALEGVQSFPDTIDTEITIHVQYEISGDPLQGLQHGGQFVVGGQGGIDQNVVAFRATRGEVVTVTPANQFDNRQVNMGDVSIGQDMSFDQFDQNMRRWLGA